MKRVSLQKAYVLHRRSYRESSALIELFTEDYGRITLVAKGVRQSRSLSSGLLQPFIPLLVSWSGKSELMSLTQIEANGPVNQLQGNYLFAGFYLNEILMCLLQKWDPHPVLFAAYEHAMSGLVGNINNSIESATSYNEGCHDQDAGKCQVQGCTLPKSMSSLLPPAEKENQYLVKSLADNLRLEKILRSFEKCLIEELGYGLLPTSEQALSQAFSANDYYRFIPEHGFVKEEAAINTDQPLRNVFSGKNLIAIAREDWQNEDCLRDAKRLMRFVLAPLLGVRPIYSRRLFMQLEEEVKNEE